MATGAYLSFLFLCVFFCFFLSISSFRILWVVSIVNLLVFWQPGSVTIGVMKCRDCRVFQSNKYLLLLLLLLLLLASVTIRFRRTTDCFVKLKSFSGACG